MNTKRNPVGWFEIYVDDMARAKAFYEATLAVTLESLPSPEPTIEMWNFPMDEGTMTQYGAPGALCKMEGCSAGAGGTLIYFSCDDCAIEEARAGKAGGTILKSKFAIGEYGFICILMDTEGNTIGLHSQK
ncbi:VOC family protein [Verrucomicrobiaceae bacterium 227]